MARGLSALWRGVVCGSVVLCAALASPAQYDVGHNITLHGQVQTQDGRPIPVGVTLSLETSEGEPVATRQSDWNGNFEFAGLSATIYTLRTKADKFQDYQQIGATLHERKEARRQ